MKLKIAEARERDATTTQPATPTVIVRGAASRRPPGLEQQLAMASRRITVMEPLAGASPVLAETYATGAVRM